MSGRLTTHVLDMSVGGPAAGVRIQLWRLADEAGAEAVLLKEIRTNDDGRANEPLLQGEAMEAGVYELVFAAGEYFAERGAAASAAAGSFLNLVPVRFRISDPASHYHVPLLVAPGGYSTYRGS